MGCAVGEAANPLRCPVAVARLPPVPKTPFLRESVLAHMQEVMGPLPGPERRVPADIRVHEEVRAGKFLRRKLTFATEPGDRLTAWLLTPNPMNGRAPGIVCLHQTTKIGKDEPVGLGSDPNLHYARELAESGLVALAPDYPNYGEYRVDPYGLGYTSATMKGIWNHMRAVDVLQSLPEVNSDRIGAIGHSLGGHNSLFLAAFDERIRATVTSCGFNSFRKYMGGNLAGWSHNGYMPRIGSAYGCDPARMPFDFSDVLAAIAPRAVFVNAPLGDDNFEVSGVRDCVEAALPVFASLGAEKHFAVEYPEAGHDFPEPVRRRAYEFLARCVRG
jgi:pimeloyl-ACP methyl ester carboxylesterase